MAPPARKSVPEPWSLFEIKPVGFGAKWNSLLERGGQEYLLKLVADKQKYLDRLQASIQALHKCRATHRRTVAVHEVFKGKTLWKGEVEVFWLTGHPQAKRCYAWGDPQNSGKITVILEGRPVIGPATAVRAALAAETKSTNP